MSGRRNMRIEMRRLFRRLEKEHGEELAIEQVIQFAFDEQWTTLRKYCAERDIRFIGDVAIFVNYDSADVWTHRDIFDAQRGPFAGSRVGCATGLLQRNGTTVGQSTVPMGTA